MDNLKKVIKGLEQYQEAGWTGINDYYRPFIIDALDALKAREPRVMTLHEIDDVINTTSKEYERIFWAEVRSRTRKSFGVFQLDIAVDDNYEALLLGCSWPACYNRSTYGIKWRCWTSRPTDEQRRAEPWK
jgi:hypothetical protein